MHHAHGWITKQAYQRPQGVGLESTLASSETSGKPTGTKKITPKSSYSQKSTKTHMKERKNVQNVHKDIQNNQYVTRCPEINPG